MDGGEEGWRGKYMRLTHTLENGSPLSPSFFPIPHVSPRRAERYETIVDVLMWLPIKGRARAPSSAASSTRHGHKSDSPHPAVDPALTDTSLLSNSAPMVG